MTVTIKKEIDGVETDVECEFTYCPPHRGARDSLGGRHGAGPALEPDEPESLEFEGACTADGTEVELSDDEIEKATDLAWQYREG